SRRDYYFNDGRQFGFEVARFEGALDTLATLMLESFLLIVLAREGFDDTNRRQDFFQDVDDFTFLLTHRPRGPLDAMRIVIDDEEECRRYEQRNHRERPVEIEHHDHHAEQRQDVHQYPEQHCRNETLHRIDIAGDPAD